MQNAANIQEIDKIETARSVLILAWADAGFPSGITPAMTLLRNAHYAAAAKLASQIEGAT